MQDNVAGVVPALKQGSDFTTDALVVQLPIGYTCTGYTAITANNRSASSGREGYETTHMYILQRIEYGTLIL